MQAKMKSPIHQSSTMEKMLQTVLGPKNTTFNVICKPNWIKIFLKLLNRYISKSIQET